MNINPMKDLTMGFGMALMQNEQALQCFSELPEDKKQQILNQTHSIRSKQEMQNFVNQLPDIF